MKLQKIPGVKSYRSLNQGLRILGASSEIGKATLEVAEGVAGTANSMGEAEYSAVPMSVRFGRNNEERSGASVQVTTQHWRDARDQVLLRLIQVMKVSK